MAEQGTGWWHQHGWTVAILLAAFALAMTVRSIFAWSVFQQYGWLYIYAGGSDSYYHSRVTQYIIMNHTNLIRDLALRYPVGAINPREPLFDWMNAVLGILFQGFFPGATPLDRASQAGAFFLDLQAPLWAGIGVFPIYLIGKEVSSKRMGLVAALLYPFIVANIDSSGLGYANYLTFYTAVILFCAYAYLRTVKATSRRRWVASYRHPRDFLTGLRNFWVYERTAVKWAVFTGVMFGTLTLAWQGFPFLIAIMVVFLVVQFLIERIRHQDSFGLYVTTWIVGLVGFPIGIPYYLVQGLFISWFYAPLILFFGVLLILLPFLLLRDFPWVVTIPVFILALLGGAAAFYLLDPATFTNVVTGQGYFVKTLVYTTVAEAQAPSVDSLILGYGVITFFLAFAGLILIGIRIVRQRFRRDLVFFAAFCVVSIYLPLTAAKFFLVGSPVYALLPAEVLILLLDVAGYSTLRRNMASLSDTRGKASAFRRSFKLRHVAVMAVVLVIVVPNVWYAIDAGIPGNTKSGFNLQVYNTLPPPLRTSAANASSYYLGAAGTSLDTPNQYDEAGYNWLATQDQNLPLYQRPAFISWWDYGFQAIDEGLHPSVADNFQNGIDPAGNFLLSQNESQAIAILTVELLAAEQTESHQPYLPAGLNALLVRDGVDVSSLHSLMVNTSADVPLVIAHPERYLPVAAANLDPSNAMYDATSWFLGNTLSLSAVSQVYDDVQAYTGWSIRYAMVDSRLIPFSGQNTGIFYAPADLTDRVINSGGVPTAFYQLSVLGSDGNTYPAGGLPAGVQAVNVNIAYSAAFYDSMIYHTYFGYNGTDIGQGAGIPGLSGAAGSDPIEPAWMLEHFQVVYRTAYYCPYANPSTHPGCGAATNLPTAESLAKAQNGSADTSAQSYFSGGEAMIEYYAGQPLVGTLELPSGAPVQSVRLTVYDGWNIPHMTTETAANGTYSLVLPPGNDTVNITTGSFTGLTQAGSTLLKTLHLYVPPAIGFADHAPPLVENVVLSATTVSGVVYFNDANNSTYEPNADRLAVGATVTLSGSGLNNYTATADASGSYLISGVAPGVYGCTVRYQGAAFPQSTPVYASTGPPVNETIALSPGSLSGYVLAPTNSTRGLAGATVTLSGSNGTVQSTITDLTGLYTLKDIVPGNYTVRASIAGTNLVSSPIPEVFTAAGGKAKLNLTVNPTVRVSLTVLAAGNPEAGVPVRFTAIVPPVSAAPTNNSSAPAGVGLDSTVFFTGPGGSLSALLPAGNYSVYSSALLGTSWYAGLGSAYLPDTSSAGLTLPPLVLGPAVLLTATVSTTPNSPTASAFGATVSAYTAHGDAAIAIANQTGAIRLPLPAGQYAVEAVQAGSSGSLTGVAALAQVNLTYPTSLSLPLSGAFLWKPQAGARVNGDPSVIPAAAAAVNVSTGPGSVPITAVADGNGTAEFLLPNSLPGGESYCIGASALGFLPYSRCGVSPATLGATSSIPMLLATVGVNLSIVGYPSGTKIHVNLSASAPPAQSASLYGGPKFNLSLYPGEYQLTAWAPYPNGSGVYQSPHPENLSVLPGFAGENVTLTLLHQLGSAGTLLLPAGVNASLVQVRLSSVLFNVSVNGQSFRTRFLATPGPYVAYTTAVVGNVTYANLTTVHLSASGSVSPSITLLGTGSTLLGTLAPPANYALNNSSLAVQLTGGDGLSVSAVAVDGSFTVILPTGGSYRVDVGGTLARIGPTGQTEYVTFATSGTVTCTATGSTSPCTVPLTATIGLSPIVGSAIGAGSSIRPDGSVLFIATDGSRTVATLSGGSFTARLLPGAYTVYAVAAGASTMLAALENLSVVNGTNFLSLSLGAAYTDTLTLVAAAGGPATANLSASRAGFPVLRLGAEAVGAPIDLTLPVGVWTLSAVSTANAYGVPTASSARTTVALLAGNAATTLTLSATLSSEVSLRPTGLLTTTTLPGSTVRFSYSIVNTGSTPVSFHLLGSPVTWNITFRPGNFTLAPGYLGVSSAEAVIVLPAGAAVAHPPFIVEAIASNGTLLGASSLSPTINIVPEPALSIGDDPKLSSIASDSVTVPFWAYNSGNTAESVAFSVGDVARLAGLGWTSSLRSGASALAASVTLSPGQNASYSVLLSAPGGHALPPGTVTVLGSVVNGSLSLQRDVLLPVPGLTVGLSNGTIAVTGPSLGSPPAAIESYIPLLVFVPAVAFLVAAFSWRWWRTRKWVRK